ncbi:uncharacterized protein J7T55_007810 [Diaporthe amygdali]|uniref:uncharacterized protein n=1 Tax=Phomopsis amygdali TaxID=1214568 RepID=UPI0022FE6EC3|nr:uncharacterized protein J7T55_007810 [Diaporthe amygdali]KAJ0107619.1 uncharacterized protein J7T55_007810 [Diaporthe amygdali]
MGDNSEFHEQSADTFFMVGDPDEFDPKKWVRTVSQPTQRQTETHLEVLIVGAGYAGLMAALECWRMGHNVIGILDRNQGPNFSGDLIIIQPSALEVFRHWPEMRRELEEDKCEAGTYYYRHNGELIDGPSQPNFNAPEFVTERAAKPGGFPYCGAVQIRKKFYRMLLRQVARLGFKVDYGQRVERYFEDDTAGRAGVVLKDGSIRTAHVVVAADGSRSASDVLIAGEHTATRSSGMSVYRTAFPTKIAMADEMVRERWQGKHTYEFWMGSSMHIGLYLSDDMTAFGITPRDELLDEGKVASESWDPNVDPDEVVRVLRRAKVREKQQQLPAGPEEDWHPVIEALVRTAPRGNLIHWPLNWRDLRRDWAGRCGRVVQVGDAAHSTVPSSAAGGTLALEDAITLAACLRRSCAAAAGEAAGAQAPLGTRVYNILRYERASCTQKMAFVNAQVLGDTTDWEAVKKNPSVVRLRYPKWMFLHDPEAYVEDKYAEAASHIIHGTEFSNTNIPPGHNFVHWTLDDIQKEMAAGKRVEDLLDGDWT